MMTPERECALVQDLLPLREEGLVSPETEAFIAEHLGRCPTCRSLLAAAQASEATLAERPVAAEGRSDGGPPQGFLRRWRLRTRILAVLAVLAVLVAAGLGASLALLAQPSAASRYSAFAAGVPGYATAAATGSLVPISRSLEIDGETVTLEAFYATYLGSYIVFRVRARDGAPVLPTLEAAPGGGAASPAASTPLSRDEVAGYWTLPGLQVPTPIAEPSAKGNPTRIALRIALGAQSAARAATFTVPRSAYLPHGRVALRTSATYGVGGALLQLDSLEISSAGTLVQGAFLGAGARPQLRLAHCPAFVERAGCDAMASWVLPAQSSGWRPFVLVLGSPTPAALKAGTVALPLGALLVERSFPIARSIAWPPKGLPGPGASGGGLILGRTAEGAVSLIAADPFRIELFTSVPGAGTRIPEVDLESATLRLPDGTDRVARFSSAMQTMSSPTGAQAGRFTYDFTLDFEKPVPAALWQETGTARISLLVGTYEARPFPKGTTWRP